MQSELINSSGWIIKAKGQLRLLLTIPDFQKSGLGKGPDKLLAAQARRHKFRSDPQHRHRRAGLSVHLYNSGAVGKRIPAACWPSSLAELVRFRFSGRFVPKSKVESNEGRYQMLTSGFHLHTEERAYIQTCMCVRCTRTCVHTHTHFILMIVCCEHCVKIASRSRHYLTCVFLDKSSNLWYTWSCLLSSNHVLWQNNRFNNN